MNVTVLRKKCKLTLWNGEPNVCQVCNSVIIDGRRKVYCSAKCSKWFEANHVWRRARTAARRRDKYSCTVCGVHKNVTPIDVDHREPINGMNYNIPSCMHHQDNLQTLCKVHHKEKTADEASLRAAKRKEEKPDSI